MKATTAKKKPGDVLREPLTVTLSPEASECVRAYRQRTGRDLCDITSGILQAEIANVIPSLDEARENNGTHTGDDSMDIMASQVEEAARLRILREMEQKTGWQPTPEPKHVVTLELSAGAYASLVILKEYEEHASVEGAILATVMRMGVQSLFQQVLGNEKDPTMAKWFGLPDDEPEE